MRWTPRRLKFFLNWYPPYLGAGVRVERISDDFLELDVCMPLRFYNRNAVGTHFGGSLYSMVDPHYMLLLIGALGPGYVVWDQAATIEFRKPGTGRVSAAVRLTPGDVERIRAATATGDAYRPQFELDIVDEAGTVIAHVTKTVYVRRKKTAP